MTNPSSNSLKIHFTSSREASSHAAKWGAATTSFLRGSSAVVEADSPSSRPSRSSHGTHPWPLIEWKEEITKFNLHKCDETKQDYNGNWNGNWNVIQRFTVLYSKCNGVGVSSRILLVLSLPSCHSLWPPFAIPSTCSTVFPMTRWSVRTPSGKHGVTATFISCCKTRQISSSTGESGVGSKLSRAFISWNRKTTKHPHHRLKAHS